MTPTVFAASRHGFTAAVSDSMTPVPTSSAALAAYPGHDRCDNPWFPAFRVVLRRGELALVPDGDAFRVGEEGDPDRLVFDTVVAGAALRARWLGGNDYYRFFTP